MQEWITKDQFHILTRPLLDLNVSKTWRGGGSAIFLELGELSEYTILRHNGTQRTSSRGQASVMIEWSWRVERPKSVVFGSDSGNRKITNGLSRLQGLTVMDITVEGRLPEIVIQLSGGFWVHSFIAIESQPEWCLFLNTGSDCRRWIHSSKGKLRLITSEAKN